MSYLILCDLLYKNMVEFADHNAVLKHAAGPLHPSAVCPACDIWLEFSEHPFHRVSSEHPHCFHYFGLAQPQDGLGPLLC